MCGDTDLLARSGYSAAATSTAGFRRAFDQDKQALLLAIQSLLDEAAFTFEDREAVLHAAAAFKNGTCGFSDCLIAAKHARLGCEFTATFDRGMRKLPGARVL